MTKSQYSQVLVPCESAILFLFGKRKERYAGRHITAAAAARIPGSAIPLHFDEANANK
jgi:hypothetical protein